MLAGAAIGGPTAAMRTDAKSTRPSGARAFRVRTLTAGIPVRSFADRGAVESTADFLVDAKRTFEAHGYEVQTVRIAINPLLVGSTPRSRAKALPELIELDELVAAHHAMISIGPVFSGGDSDETIGQWARELVGRTRVMNFSGAVASLRHGVHREAVSTAGRIMAALSDATKDGAANFRFAAAACVSPGTPFFPAGYHEGSPSLAVGLESANLVRQAFTGITEPAKATEELRALLNAEFAPVDRLALELAQQGQRRYLGIDSSPAPGRDSSIGEALETLTGSAVGGASTLQACAAVTAAIKSLTVMTCGYSGLMLPVLEDPTLAARAAEGRLGVAKLLLYSSVCGTGLDVVPLPGDASAADLARIIGDVATLAVRLRKPLSARLFPVPGKRVGDSISFSDPLLTASRVLALDS
jgi:uncharacterized protein